MLTRVIHAELRIFAPLAALSPSFTCKFSSDAAGHEEMPTGSKEVTTTVSSLRIDSIASAGLNISRRNIWELFMDGRICHNGQKAKKKSTIVAVGDVIDVENAVAGQAGAEVKRTGRVVVKEIGEARTKKGRWHVTLLRHKHLDFSLKDTSSSKK